MRRFGKVSDFGLCVLLSSTPAAVRLICVVLVIKGNEGGSYLNRGQAARGLTSAIWKTNLHLPSLKSSSSAA